MKKRIVTGILAHVDAGKTTCIEQMLYQSGQIRKLGRVDHKDAFLDFDAEERNHGITIYAKEAFLEWNDTEIYVIDTPGHVDFSSEMERSLQVLDLAVILISGQDGVQSHTETIWRCLEHYHIPALIFVNKMDISFREKEDLMHDLIKHFTDACIDWSDPEKEEKLAVINDDILNEYMENGAVSSGLLQEAFMQRQLYPVLFGSALKGDGVKELLDLITDMIPKRSYPDEFGARVYKISEDTQKNRLTHVRITGGVLHARDKINEEEKVDQIRIYSGKDYKMVSEAEAGMVCVLKGLNHAEAGQGLGFEESNPASLLHAFMSYEIAVPKGVDLMTLGRVCRKLAEQDPQLQISADEKTHKISVQIMGEMQKEILQKRIFEECGIMIGFSEGRILYQETIREPVSGSGHFEPLRHYAEVHVRLAPLERGSGLEFVNECIPDTLSAGFQKSIMDALERKRHKGVLTGSPLTDVRISLIAGKGHLKHTMGGDFREAAGRAVRQALMKADNILLEPYYDFILTVPGDNLSYALYDLEQRNASVNVENNDQKMRITGRGPVRRLMNYQNEVISYTKGKGLFTFQQAGYFPSEEQGRLTEESGYDPEMDFRNPPDSVFCANGSGYIVPWYKADESMHIQIRTSEETGVYRRESIRVREDQLETILEKATGNNRSKKKPGSSAQKKPAKPYRSNVVQLPKYLIVDGYNIIYDWPELKELAKDDLFNAREKLIAVMAEYQAYTGQKMMIVFDGYQVRDNYGSRDQKGELLVVYTKYGETADAYIEKISLDLEDQYDLTVASSDGLVQNAILAHGALRISARQLKNMIEAMEKIYSK